jgi:hypothetical protein
MAALLIVMCGLSSLTIIVLIWLRCRLRNARANYAEEARSLETNALISELDAGQQHVFWTGIWRAIVRSDRKKSINQVFNNYCLLLTGIIPLLVSCLTVLGRQSPTLESVDVVLNVTVSGVALVLGKFGFAKYADQHDRTNYMLTSALNDYLSGAGDYFGLALDVRFIKLHQACDHIMESNTTSIVGERKRDDVWMTKPETIGEVLPELLDEPEEQAIAEYAAVFPVTQPERVVTPETAVKPEDFGKWQAAALGNPEYDEITQG